MTVLHTERLILRPWTDADRPALERMVQDPAMMHFLTPGRTWTTEETDELLGRQARHLVLHGVCFEAAQRRDTGEVIGLVGMQQLDNGDFEAGWWIWKDYWGQGYALEAAQAFVDHARGTMGLQRLVAVIDPDNQASKRVAEKLGMRFECIKSARETIAKREDRPIAIYAMGL